MIYKMVSHLVLDTRVLSLCVLTNEHSVDVVVGSLKSLDRGTRAHIRKEVECSAESQVERNVALSDCKLYELSNFGVKNRLYELGVARGPGTESQTLVDNQDKHRRAYPSKQLCSSLPK